MTLQGQRKMSEMLKTRLNSNFIKKNNTQLSIREASSGCESLEEVVEELKHPEVNVSIGTTS
jgi:hypothetical protein